MPRWYVHTTTGSDITGDGSLGNPYATGQYVLDNETRSNFEVNIIEYLDDGTDTWTGGIDISTFGNQTQYRRMLNFKGQPGSRVTFDGDGGIFMDSFHVDNITFSNIIFENYGADFAFDIDNTCRFYRCRFNANHIGGGVSFDNESTVEYCEFYNLGLTGINTNNDDGIIANNYIETSTSCAATSYAIASSARIDINNNIIVINHDFSLYFCRVFDLAVWRQNLIHITGDPTTTKIIGDNANDEAGSFYDNIVFLDNDNNMRLWANNTGQFLKQYGRNFLFNVTAADNTNGIVVDDLGGNTTLTIDPFVDKSNRDYRIKRSALSTMITSGVSSIPGGGAPDIRPGPTALYSDIPTLYDLDDTTQPDVMVGEQYNPTIVGRQNNPTMYAELVTDLFSSKVSNSGTCLPPTNQPKTGLTAKLINPTLKGRPNDSTN